MAAPKGNDYYKLRLSDGRNLTFDDPDDMATKCNEYFDWIQENPFQEAVLHQKSAELIDVPKMKPFTLGGLCNYLGITIDTFKAYKKKEDFLLVYDQVRQIIDVHQFEGAASGFLNPSIIARKLGLVDNVRNENYNKEIPVTKEEIDAQIKELEDKAAENE